MNQAKVQRRHGKNGGSRKKINFPRNGEKVFQIAFERSSVLTLLREAIDCECTDCVMDILKDCDFFHTETGIFEEDLWSKKDTTN